MERSPLRGSGGRQRVIVVGSLNVDLTLTVPRLPVPGETVFASGVKEHLGGKGANQAVAAARAGASVTMIGSCGGDEPGRLSLAQLREEGIDVSAVTVNAKAQTGQAVIMVDEMGENQIVVSPGANSLLGASAVRARFDDLRPGSTDIVLVSFEVPEDVVLAAASAALAGASLLIVNPAPVRDLRPAMLGGRVILTPNEAEAIALGKDADVRRAAAAMSDITHGPVVVTRGGQGVLVRSGGWTYEAPALAVPVVDTTGAGDTFSGVLAAWLAEGGDLGEAVSAAIVAASLSTRAEGPRKGIPARSEIAERTVGAGEIRAALRGL